MKLSTMVSLAVLCGAMTAPAFSSADSQRGGDQHGGGGGGSHGGGGGSNNNRGGGGNQHQNSRPAPQRQSTPPPAHAQREPTRTNNYVPRGTGSIPRQQQQQRLNNDHPVQRQPIQRNAPRVVAQRHFTKTAQGRVYDNGLVLHKGIKVTAAWQKRYFPQGHYHFGFYRTSYVRGQTFFSPFAFFFGVCVPFIAASECHVYPPATVWIDIPVYHGVVCAGFNDAANGNLMNDPEINAEEPGLFNAIDDLREAFGSGNIDYLASLVDPNTNVGVYFRGKYQYSLSGNDYLDVSRDAIQSMHTVNFNLSYLHQRAPGVFSVGGTQVYQDQNGNQQTTWVSYVLQDIGGQWTLTQTGTAPASYRRPVF